MHWELCRQPGFDLGKNNKKTKQNKKQNKTNKKKQTSKLKTVLAQTKDLLRK